MDFLDLFLGVVGFTSVVLILVLIILAARSQLVSTGSVSIEIDQNIDMSTSLILIQPYIDAFFG
mgnify:CR=1 FL=1